MIIDIPSHTDFIESGTDLLNLAWASVISLAISIEEAAQGNYGLDIDEDATANYWKAAQRSLTTAIALVQQGTEFILKGHIAETSPFLLISGSPNEWPRGCDQQDTPFSAFKTIDAQELVRAHDTVSRTRLSDEFKSQFENLRQLRNQIMHTVGNNLQVSVKDILLTILEVSHQLLGSQQWIVLRRQFIEREPESVTFGTDYLECGLIREISMAISILEPALVTKHFEFNKHQRRYLCPQCLMNSCDDVGIEPNLAQLMPNNPTSTNVHCIICRNDHSVRREACNNSDCKGNVIDIETNMCLTCGTWQ